MIVAQRHFNIIYTSQMRQKCIYIYPPQVPNQRKHPAAAKGRANDRRLAFLLVVEGLSSLFGLASIIFLRLFICKSSPSDPDMAADNDFLLAQGNVFNNLSADFVSELSSSFCSGFLVEIWFTNW